STVTEGRHRHNQRGASIVAFVLAAVASVILVAAQFLGGASAQATGGSKTVDITVNVPAMVVDNLCNGDTVNLSGDMHIITTTTPRKNGGYTVSSTTIAKDLQGERIAPPPAIGYHGDDV